MVGVVRGVDLLRCEYDVGSVHGSHRSRRDGQGDSSRERLDQDAKIRNTLISELVAHFATLTLIPPTPGDQGQRLGIGVGLLILDWARTETNWTLKLSFKVPHRVF